jgi:hypothetical protein
MSTRRPFVKAANGLVHITNPDLDFDTLTDAVNEWVSASKAADDDYDNRRWGQYDTNTRPAADSAADDVRDTAGLQLDWEAALRFSDDIARAAATARQQATKLTNPMLREA